MKIIVKNNNSERQSPEVTIDTSTCHYPYAIREALQLALELDGYTKETINEVFGIMPDTCKQDAGGQAEPAQEQGHFTFDEKGYTEAVFYLLDNGKYKDATDEYANLSYAKVVNAANELWEKRQNEAQAKQEQEQAEREWHFPNNPEGHSKALKWAESIGYTGLVATYPRYPQRFIKEVNKIWVEKQQTA